jgi:hypothetical protein
MTNALKGPAAVAGTGMPAFEAGGRSTMQGE